MSYASFLLLMLMSAFAWPGEAKSPEILQAVKRLHNDAVNAGDWWTALQCEAYSAVKLKTRMAPVLGPSEIFGDPLFAFPSDFIMVHDGGDRVLAITAYATYVIAPDGRPLTLAQRHGFTASTAAVSYDHSLVALFAYDSENGGNILVRSLAESGPKSEKINVSLPVLEKNSSVNFHQCALANDGSATAGMLGYTWSTSNSIVVARAGNNKPETIPGLRLVHAIGSKGAWLIADQAFNIDNSSRDTLPVLRLDDNNIPIKGWAAGPDIAVVLMTSTQAIQAGVKGITSENASVIAVQISPNGKQLTVLPVPFAFGDYPKLSTIGDFLLVYSGNGAVQPMDTDLIGNALNASDRQPGCYALYRWNALLEAKGALVRPSEVSSATAIPSPNHMGAFYTWDNKDLFLVDLSNGEPVVRKLASYSQTIHWIDSNNMRLVVQFADNLATVTDAEGKALWSGKGSLHLHGPDWMVVTKGSLPDLEYYAVCLTTPEVAPENRPLVKLAIKTPFNYLAIDPFGRFGYVTHSKGDDATRTFFSLLDGLTFKVPASQENYYWSEERRSFDGRFCNLSGRLYTKVRPTPDGTLGEWQISDAIIEGSGKTAVALVLDVLGQVWTAKRNGPFTKIGACLGARRFVCGASGVLLTDRNQQALGKMDQGPKVVPGIGGKAPSEIPGPWRLERWNLNLMPPRLPGLHTWSVEKTCFLPLTLHSPGNGSLVVTTPGLVLGLDASLGRMVAVPFQSGRSR